MMFSSQFLSSYYFFTAAVTTYRDCIEEMRIDPENKAVAEAFKKATSGMSKQEQTMLTQFLLRLLQLPEEYEQDRKQRYYLEADLDRESAVALAKLDHCNDVLNVDEFMARAGVTRDILADKLQ
jgi:hypothetical protein